MSTRSEQALLVRNLNTLRYWVEKTGWERDWAKGLDQERIEEIKASMRDFTRDLGDRCQYNLGWHAAKNGTELENRYSTSALNSQLSDLIKAIESHGKVKRGRGQPRASAKLSKVQRTILEKHHSDPKKRSLEYFVTKAMHDGDLPDSQEIGTALKSLERARDRAIEAGTLDTKYSSRAIDPSELSMEEYAEWQRAGHPVFRTKPLKKQPTRKKIVISS